ncbi:MAG: transposase [Pirellulaceae bacterium]|nr:transposase [Pirellulaceae bacterium]
MYDYRRWTNEQRRQVVQQRHDRGFPLHRLPIWTSAAGGTSSRPRPTSTSIHFREANELSALTLRILEEMTAAAIPICGWVVLPNHYHLLVRLDQPKQIGASLGRVHGRSSRYANLRDQSPGRQVWYRYNDRKVRSERHFWTCLHYIMINPVKHRHAEDLSQWPWSCFHEVLAERGQSWIDDLQWEYPLLDFGKGWDD